MSQLRFWLQFAALNKVTGLGPSEPPRATCGAPELPQVAELCRRTPPALPTLYFYWQVTVNMPEYCKPEIWDSGSSWLEKEPQVSVAQLPSVLGRGQLGVSSS